MKQKQIFLVLVLALAAVVLSGCAGRTGFTNSWPGLATDGEFAYLATGQYVYAIRLNDGREVWRYPGKASNSLQFIAQPVITPDGMIVVGSAGSDNRLVALDPARIDVETNSPEEAWIFSGADNRWVASPLLFDGKLFAPNTDGTLYVLDYQDDLTTKIPLMEKELGGALWAQPSTDGDLIYVSSLDHHLYAVNPETYEFAWPAIDLGGAAPDSPLIAPDNNLFVGSFAAEVVKIDSTSGSVIPFASAKDWVWGEPVTDGGIVYFGDLEGFFYAVEASSGEPVWSIQPDGPIVGSPVVISDSVVFVTESGSVYAVDQTGEIVWREEVGGQIYTTPVVGAERIIVAPMQAEFLLAVLDSDGNQVWTFNPDK